VSDDPEVLPTDVAVIGMAARMPGAQSAWQLWRNMVEGVESIVTLTRAELLASGESEEQLAHPNYVPRWAGLADVEGFDAAFFGLSRLEGDVMDPQQRHFLEVCVESLENAGIPPSRFEGNIGVYAASGYNAYFPLHVLTHRELVDDVGFFLLRHTGNDKDFLATRVAYCLGLRGPAINVQTACSSSLVAIHLAAQSLIARETDLALAGGVTIELPARRGYVFREGEILAPDGRCRAFDAAAQGTVFGSGAGVVVLRRLEDALAAGDHIYAVIKGSAINNDGNSKVGYLAPSVEGQARCVTEALAIAGVRADRIGYVECHGTGTAVGDPIEIQALTDAFRQTTDARQYCAISSAKPNIGHLDTAAGVASFIKAVYSVRAGELAPTLHFSQPNPRIDLLATPFFVASKRQAWPLSGPRLATVNSLGVGGTNAHVVLTEPPKLKAPRPAQHRFAPLVWSARSSQSANSFGKKLAACTEADGVEADAGAAAASLLMGRELYAERRVAAVSELSELELFDKRVQAITHDGINRKLVFVFSGGGAAHPNMGRDLYEREPVYRGAMDDCLARLNRSLQEQVRAALFPSADGLAQAKLAMERPSIQLPAQLATQLAMVAWLRSFGVDPAACIGHSLGEYSAAHLAGVFDLTATMRIVTARGELFETLAEGAMLSVSLDEDSFAKKLQQYGINLDIAAVNSAAALVAAGPLSDIAKLEDALTKDEIDCRRLRIKVAAHSSMLEPILAAFGARLSNIRFSPPAANQPRFVSNLSGTWAGSEVATSEYWVRHLRSRVRFDSGLKALLQAGTAVLLDVGPGHGLSSVLRGRAAENKSIVVTAMRHATETLEDDRAAITALGTLCAMEVAPSHRVAKGFAAERIPLPTYVFDHQRHWLTALAPAAEKEKRQAVPLVKLPPARWFWRETWREKQLTAADTKSIWWLGQEESALAQTLVARGVNVERFLLQDEKQLLFKLQEDALPDAVVYAVPSAGQPSLEHFEVTVALARALVERDAEKPPRLVFVTAGTNPQRALVAGVLEVAPKELPGLETRWIDVADGASAETVADVILSGSTSPSERFKVQCDRVTERLVERADVPLVGAPPMAAGEGVLIFGGTSGIGLEVALGAAAHGVRVIVTGRSEPSSEVRQRLEMARATGQHIEAVLADVTQRDQVDQALQHAEQHGPVAWVFLSAGALDDQPLVSKAAAARARVLAPKQLGITWLRELLPASAKLVAFSSTSTFVGPPGQVDYVAANAMLEASADDRVRVVSWGMWRDVGMARRARSDSSSKTEGSNAAGHPFLPASSDGGRGSRQLSAADWVLDEHRLLDGTAVLPGTAYVELMRGFVGQGRGFTPFALDRLELHEALVEQAGRPVTLAVERRAARVSVVSSTHQGREIVHASAELSSPSPRPQAFDVSAHQARIGSPAQFVATSDKPWRQQPQALSFGPRWQVVKEAAFNGSEAWANLQLNPRYLDDLKRVMTHPALLDLATAFALSLAGPAQPDRVYVPVRYGRFEQYAPFEAELCSFVKLVSRDAGDRVTFDITITSAEGDVIAVVSQFQMRSVPAAALVRPSSGPSPTSLLELGATHGIATEEGLSALWSVLSGNEQKLYVSSLDLEALALLVRPARPQAAPSSLRPQSLSSAPRDEVERQLAAMFEALLGATTVDRDSDFFALGGHSLLAVRLFNRIKKLFDVELAMSVLFEAPSVKTLGELVRGSPAPESPSADTTPISVRPQAVESRGLSLVPIQRGDSRRRPLFCVHGAGGNVLNFRDLALHLDPSQRLYGLQARGVDGTLSPHTSMAEMARDYLLEVKTVQPGGPYVLGGYSGGGVVAYEMAQQLLAAGEEVAVLIFLDTFVPGLSPHRMSLLQRVKSIQEKGFNHVRYSLEWAVERRLKERKDNRKLTEVLESRVNVPFELRGHWLAQNFQRLSGAYTPQPYRGRVVLFRAEEIDKPYAYVGGNLGWEKFLTRELELVVVPGDHESLILEPNVFPLARELNRILDEVS